jgi:hypothetical protein
MATTGNPERRFRNGSSSTLGIGFSGIDGFKLTKRIHEYTKCQNAAIALEGIPSVVCRGASEAPRLGGPGLNPGNSLLISRTGAP